MKFGAIRVSVQSRPVALLTFLVSREKTMKRFERVKAPEVLFSFSLWVPEGRGKVVDEIRERSSNEKQTQLRTQ